MTDEQLDSLERVTEGLIAQSHTRHTKEACRNLLTILRELRRRVAVLEARTPTDSNAGTHGLVPEP